MSGTKGSRLSHSAGANIHRQKAATHSNCTGQTQPGRLGGQRPTQEGNIDGRRRNTSPEPTIGLLRGLFSSTPAATVMGPQIFRRKKMHGPIPRGDATPSPGLGEGRNRTAVRSKENWPRTRPSGEPSTHDARLVYLHIGLPGKVRTTSEIKGGLFPQRKRTRKEGTVSQEKEGGIEQLRRPLRLQHLQTMLARERKKQPEGNVEGKLAQRTPEKTKGSKGGRRNEFNLNLTPTSYTNTGRWETSEGHGVDSSKI